MLDKKWEYNGTVHQLFIDFKKVYDSISREVLYNILIEFEIPRKLAGLINSSQAENGYICSCLLHVSGKRIVPELVRGTNKVIFLPQEEFLSHSRWQ
jgi:hypothetical protein